MQGTVAITDHGWYEFLHSHPGLDEVNFWTPSSYWSFNAEPGSPFFFKLKAKYNHAICGFAYFARYAPLPDWLAWDWFQEKNGCPDLQAMRTKIYGIRKSINFRSERPLNEIGCILLVQPTFFRPEEFINGPRDWPGPNLRPMKYNLLAGEGLRVWNECQSRTLGRSKTAGVLIPSSERYGKPTLVAPRLGQGTFRVSVMEAYSRACAVTQEHSLPALEASHIRPYHDQGPHQVSNGILLRADIHRLFDQGYLTITKELKLEVSPRLKVDYHNGHTYYPLHGTLIKVPAIATDTPNKEFLEWHNEKVFRAA